MLAAVLDEKNESCTIPGMKGLEKNNLLYDYGMMHRHLTHQELTLAAIDDIIARGRRRDWARLRRAALDDRVVLDKVLRVCLAQVADPYAQRYHFWKQYAERYLA